MGSIEKWKNDTITLKFLPDRQEVWDLVHQVFRKAKDKADENLIYRAIFLGQSCIRRTFH
jgi:hypothetical protein